MEDKWFSYMDGNTLYAHRSWTGYCIYIIEINEETGCNGKSIMKKQFKENIKKEQNNINKKKKYCLFRKYEYLYVAE